MALKCLCGIPGSGKTLEATRIALKHYKKENNIIKKTVYHIGSILGNKKCTEEYKYYSMFPKRKINNIYTNYPVLLDKKRGIYTNKIDLWKLDNTYSFLPNALIIIDEVQLYVDSDEYKDKNQNARIRVIAKFLQAHRHFGIKDIYFISQHPSRIFKKARNICESYLKLKKVIRIPFTPYAMTRGRGYYEFDYYGRFVPKDRQERKKLPFDYFKHFKIFNCKKVFSAYDSRYLALYNYDKSLYNELHESPKLSMYDLEILFNS